MSREDKVLVQIAKTMRGIWLCPSSHVYIFEVKIKTSIAVRWLMFKGRSHYVNIKYFDIFIISQLIWKFKKCGKVISLLSFSDCFCGPCLCFCPMSLSFIQKNLHKTELKIHFKTKTSLSQLIIDHTAAPAQHWTGIVYSRTPSVLITLLGSRFRNARLFFAHCLISCRGIMEVGTAYQYTSLNPSGHLPDFERFIMTRHQVTASATGFCCKHFFSRMNNIF